MNIFILGDENIILGFRFAGINGKIVEGKEEINIEFDKVINGEYGNTGVLLVSEEVSMVLGEKLVDWQIAGEYPLIVEIPGINGHLEDRKTILQSIREAVGLHV